VIRVVGSVPAMSKQNPPHDHHYIPVFYLKRWVNPRTKKVIEFSKPHEDAAKRIVVRKRRFPTATGFLRDGYTLIGVKPEDRQALENRIMVPVDNAAADALERLYAGGTLAPKEYFGWTRFIASLILRTPQDVEIMKRGMKAVYDKTVKETIGSLRRKGYKTPSAKEIIARMTKEDYETEALILIGSLIENPISYRSLLGLSWKVFDLPLDAPSFLTSDQPVIRTNGLKKEISYIVMPIGPRKLLVASFHQSTFDWFSLYPARELVRDVNYTVAAQAVACVWAIDDAEFPMISKCMGTVRPKSMARTLMTEGLKRK